MCIADCKYDVVRKAARSMGWKLVDELPEAGTRKCHVYWVDVPAIIERMQQLNKWQRINHFPGMQNVARKGRLAQNLDRMRRSFPFEFSFYPRTWVLPAEWGGFKAEFDANGKSTRTFIIKPDSGCQGKGIFLTQNLDRVASMENQVAQLYVRKPLLIEGFKFDLRLYVLVTSVIPLRVYAFKDGLTRFCTEEYNRPASDNLKERCMHLTNYAVNKCSANFVANDEADRDDIGSKRSLRWLLDWIASEHGREKADTLWRKMSSACVKTLISVLPILHREYFQTFGPDKGIENTENTSDCSRNMMSERAERDTNFSAGDVYNTPGEEALNRPPQGKEIGSERDVSSSPSGDGALNISNQYSARNPECDDIQAIKEPFQVGPERRLGDLTGSPDENGNSSARNGKNKADGEAVVEGSRCVEILGFDFMIDSALKPWLIEVNHLPSFATDSPLDVRIKSQVVGTALSVLRAKADDRKSYEENAKRDAQNRLYNPENLVAGALLREQELKEAEAVVAKIRRQVMCYIYKAKGN